MRKKIVIIGAGPAGLSAGYNVLKNSKKYDVIILEQCCQVGGISKTVSYDGNRMDLGGHRFFTKDKDVSNFWMELMPPQCKPSIDEILLGEDKKYAIDGKDPQEEDNVFLQRRRVSRIYYKNRFFDYPVNLSFRTIKNLGIKDTIVSGLSYLKTLFVKLPEDNLENFYINRFGRKLYEIFFKDYTEKLWGIDPSKIDSSWGSQRVKGISICAVIKDYFNRLFKIKNLNKEISLIEKFNYPKYGPGQMYEQLKNKFIENGGVIKLNSEVVGIEKKNDKIIKILYKENNNIYVEKVDYVVSSMPIKNLVSSMNNVPDNIRYIADNLPYRDFLTVGIVVDNLQIKNDSKIKTINNIIPDTWIYVQSGDVKLGRIQVFNNWSPYLVKDYPKSISLGLEYFCNENDDFWSMEDSQLKSYAINDLIKIGIISNSTNIYSYHVERVKKAYPAYFGSYNRFSELKNYLNSIDNLYCIGRNGMHRYNNMDHSIKSGIVCATNIINNISDKENIWNVNSNQDYNEEVK